MNVYKTVVILKLLSKIHKLALCVTSLIGFTRSDSEGAWLLSWMINNQI